MLVNAVMEGADLPPRPLLITFDDGNSDNYFNAFPIMQKYGFTGVVYIIGNYMGTPGYMNADQIKVMAAAGWEVGSHSMSHLDLSELDPQRQRYEIVESREKLESELGFHVMTFAYPFGITSTEIIGRSFSDRFVKRGWQVGNTIDVDIIDSLNVNRVFRRNTIQSADEQLGPLCPHTQRVI